MIFLRTMFVSFFLFYLLSVASLRYRKAPGLSALCCKILIGIINYLISYVKLTETVILFSPVGITGAGAEEAMPAPIVKESFAI